MSHKQQTSDSDHAVIDTINILPSRTPLHSSLVLLVRIGWVASVALLVLLVIVSIPFYSAYLHLPRLSTTAGDSPIGQLSLSGQQELHAAGISLSAYSAFLITCNLVQVGGFLLVGSLIFWRAWGIRGNGMAVWASFFLITFPIDLIDTMLESLPPSWHPLFLFARFLGDFNFSLFLYLFPTGQFFPGWTRWLALSLVATWGIYDFLPAASTPSSPIAAITFLCIVGFMGAVIPLQVIRYRRLSQPVFRQQVKWVSFGVGTLVGGFILWSSAFTVLYFQGSFSHVLVRSLFVVAQVLVLVLPVSIGFAVLRYRLWDIDIIINRTLVYGTLTASVVALYILVVGYLGTLFRTSGNLVISLVATGLVAVLFQPLRDWLQRGVNRLMYGQRDEPYQVISRLGQRLEATLAPDAVLPAIVETVAQALKLPYVAVALKDGDSFSVMAVHGSPVDAPLLLPLAYQTELIGQLVLGPRQRGETFTPTDRRLLEDLARQVGIAAHDVRLMGELQRSRERLVTTLEEERRRLRRDLHDGLGSTLTSLMFKLDATDTLLDRDLPAARTLLAEVRGHMQTSIAEIRHLVYNLRPPTLDEWGLVGALREHIAQYALGEVQVILEVPEVVPPLSAAAEVAAYRIVLEALANVVKHAHATRCIVHLDTQPETLTVEVRDDGIGRPANAHAGVGTMAMRERAAELGGVCVIDAINPQGTRIWVSIPIRKA